MPGTRTLTAFTQMNSPAEISRLPGPAATSPASQAWITACQAATGAGCPGSGASAANVSRCARRVTPGGWQSARGAEQLRRRLGAGGGGAGTGPGARHQHRPGIPRVRSGPNASTAPQPACSVMSGSSGQPAMIRQGPGTPPGVSGQADTTRARGPDECQAEPRAGSGPRRLVRASGFRSASYPHADESEVSCARFGHRAQPAITEVTCRWTVS
jgi:hypothetical protein